MEEHNYLLASIEETGKNEKSINKIRSLSKGEYDLYSNEVKEINDYEKENSLFNIILLNHKDFHSKINYYLKKYEINTSEGTAVFIDLNRHVLNCLFSIRTFLDHTEARLKRKFGKESDEYKYFKKLTSNCFDSNFSYRFLSKLRNYAQHCGLPTGSITFNENHNGKNLHISFSRDDLLSNYDSWGQHVKPYLEEQNEEFDLIPILDEVINDLKEINKKIDLVLIKKLSRQGFHLFSLIDETQRKGTGTPCVVKFVPNGGNAKMNMGWFPIGMISKITGIKIV